MSKFEDHLWREVERQHGADLEPAGRPPARHSRLGPRILAAGGKMGGFSAPGGLLTKEKLLLIEGATTSLFDLPM